jgi:hypothetical protein
VAAVACIGSPRKDGMYYILVVHFADEIPSAGGSREISRARAGGIREYIPGREVPNVNPLNVGSNGGACS